MGTGPLVILFSIGSHTHINYSVLSSDIAARLKITGGYDQSLLALGGVKKLCNFESLIPDSLVIPHRHQNIR